jgi:hypothetical protein
VEAVSYELYLLDRHYAPRVNETSPNWPMLEYPDLSSASLLHDELASLVLAHMYAYRAQLAGLYIAVKYDSTRNRQEHAEQALWEFAQVILAARRYIDVYGAKLAFLGRDDSMTGLLRLAGWYPPFTKRESDWLGLAYMRAPEPTVDSFIATLRGREIGEQLYVKWREQLVEAAGRVGPVSAS